MSLKVWNLLGEASNLVDRARRQLVGADDAVGERNAVIVFTKRRRLVNDASSAVACYVGVVEYSEGAVLVLSTRLVNNRPNTGPTCLFCEVVKHGGISPSLHIRTLELANFLKVSFLGVFIESSKQVLVDDEVAVVFRVVDFDVSEVWMDAETEVARQSPRGGRPCKEARRWVVDQGEGYGD